MAYEPLNQGVQVKRSLLITQTEADLVGFGDAAERQRVAQFPLTSHCVSFAGAETAFSGKTRIFRRSVRDVHDIHTIEPGQLSTDTNRFVIRMGDHDTDIARVNRCVSVRSKLTQKV